MRRAIVALGFVVALIATPSFAMQEKPVKVLSGWPGAFLEVFMYNRQFEKPKADKESWQQTARYDWSGGRAETIRVTLMRDPAEAKKYQKPQPESVKMIKIGDRTAWEFEGGKLVIDLGKDRLMILDAPTWKQTQTDLAKFAERFALDACAKALDQPPRTDFRRKVELFRTLTKGMSFNEVREHVGDTVLDIGSTMHIFVYALDDGTRVLVGFRDLKALTYVKHQDKNGTTVDLVK